MRDITYKTFRRKASYNLGENLDQLKKTEYHKRYSYICIMPGCSKSFRIPDMLNTIKFVVLERERERVHSDR
jgi:hypothetical protein